MGGRPCAPPAPLKETGRVRADGVHLRDRRGSPGWSQGPGESRCVEARQDWVAAGAGGWERGAGEVELVLSTRGQPRGSAVGAGGAVAPAAVVAPPAPLNTLGGASTAQALAPWLDSCKTPLPCGSPAGPLRPEPLFLAAPPSPVTSQPPPPARKPPSRRAALQLCGLASGSDAGLSERGPPTSRRSSRPGRALGSLPASQGLRLPVPLSSALLLPSSLTPRPSSYRHLWGQGLLSLGSPLCGLCPLLLANPVLPGTQR